MIEASATVTRKYQITIPSAIRRKLGLSAGDKVYLVSEGDTVTLRSAPKGWTEASAGLGADLWASAGGSEAIEAEREAWDR
jgi:AbrB family looped-hinge helix DNA binding protein